MAGMTAGKRLAEAAGGPEQGVGEELVVELMAPPGQRARRAVAAVVALGQAAVRVREPVELEVLVGAAQFVQPGDDLGPAHRLLARGQQEGRDHPQGHRGQHAERSEPDPGGLEQLGGLVRGTADDAAVGQDHLQRRHLRGDTAQVPASAMGAGLDRARDRLLLDVTHVRQGQPAGVQGLVEVPEPAAGLDRDLPGFLVHRPDGLQPAGAEHHPAGRGDGGEGVAGAGHPHGQAVPRGQRDCLGDLRCGVRRDHPLRRGGLVTRPVLPAGYGEDHARTLSERAGKAGSEVP